MKLKDLLQEDDMDAYVTARDQWTKDLLTLLKGEKLGRDLKNQNVHSQFEGVVEFSTKVDELQLDWFLSYDQMRGKPIGTVQVSSPNKRGFFEKKASGKNASPKGLWMLINNIYNGKFKR